jgi:cellulose synthase/poly-beta-1,6-N-acetylglucosamine synthase-like glycosyltransferase
MILSVTDVVLAVTYFLVLYLSVFWLLVLLEKKELPQKIVTSWPAVSVIIPAYNEENTIRKSVESVFALDYDNLQLIVVNDGSTDKTKEIVEQLQQNAPLPFIFLNQENKGKGAALNHALQHVTGEYYATLDADSTVDSGLMKKLMPYFVDDNVASVLPLLKVRNPENILQRIQRYEYIINMFYKNLNAKLDCVHVTPGPCSVYRTTVIQQLGGYDEHNITEDLEIAIRLQKHHYKIVQTAEAAVYTIPPDTVKALYRQRNRWYKGSVLNSFKHRAIMFNREYGDFGTVRLPTIILSGILSVIILFTLGFDAITLVAAKFSQLASVNFDIFTFLKNWSFNFHILDLSFLKLFVAGFVIILGLGVMVASFRHSQEKIARYGKTFFTLCSYMLLYGLLLSVVWLMIGVEIMRGKVQKW